MKKSFKKIMVLCVSVFASLAFAGPGVYLIPVELTLPGGTTNVVKLFYPGVSSIVAPAAAYAPNTNGTISLTWTSSTSTNAFTLPSFASGSLKLDMTAYPRIEYGGFYTFTDSSTETNKIIVVYDILNP